MSLSIDSNITLLIFMIRELTKNIYDKQQTWRLKKLENESHEKSLKFTKLDEFKWIMNIDKYIKNITKFELHENSTW